MKHLIVLVLLGLVIGCAAAPTAVPATAVPTVASPTTAAKSGTLRLGIIGASTIKDLPKVVAIEQLKAQGYAAEIVAFDKGDQMADALARGDVQVATVNTNVAWTAVAKGADFRSVVDDVKFSFFIITNNKLQTCQDLDGKTLAFATLQSVGYTLFSKYVKENCPDVKPNILLITESQNRVVSLEANKVDGAYIELQDWIGLQKRAPNDFHAFLNFTKQYPQLEYSTVSANRPWAQANPQPVEDLIRALLTAERQFIANPQSLAQESVNRFKLNPDDAKTIGNAYLDLGIWDPNGGLKPDYLQQTMDIMTQNGAVPKGTTVDQVTDTTYLNAVLNEIGKK